MSLTPNVYMMYCIMLLVLVDRYHTTSGMVYYPLGLTPTMYMMHCIVGVLGVERGVTYIMWCTYTSDVLSSRG